MRNCYPEDVFKASWKKRNVCWEVFSVIHVSAEANRMGLLENFSIKNIENYEGYIQNVFRYPHKQPSDVLKNFTGKHQSLFNKNNFNKKESNTGVFLWNLQHFKNIYFEEYMRMIPSECPWKVLWLKLKWEEGIRVGLKHMGGIICSVSLDVIRRTIRR